MMKWSETTMGSFTWYSKVSSNASNKRPARSMDHLLSRKCQYIELHAIIRFITWFYYVSTNNIKVTFVCKYLRSKFLDFTHKYNATKHFKRPGTYPASCHLDKTPYILIKSYMWNQFPAKNQYNLQQVCPYQNLSVVSWQWPPKHPYIPTFGGKLWLVNLITWLQYFSSWSCDQSYDP